MMRALRAGVIGPVRIRACVEFRWVRMGPVVRGTGPLRTGAVGSLGTGGVVAMDVVDLRV